MKPSMRTRLRLSQRVIAELREELRAVLDRNRSYCERIGTLERDAALLAAKRESEVASRDAALSKLSEQRTQLINMCDRLIGGAA